MRRREFLLGAVLAAPVVARAGKKIEMQLGDAGLALDESGAILGFSYRGTQTVRPQAGGAHPQIASGERAWVCDHPRQVRRDGATAVFEYALNETPGLQARYEVGLLPMEGGALLRRHLRVEFAAPPADDVLVSLPIHTRLPEERRKVFVPMRNGIGRKKDIQDLDNDDEYVFQMAGSTPAHYPQPLALPMLDEYADGAAHHLAYCSDASMTSYFRLPFGDRTGALECILPSGPDVAQRVFERTLFTALHGRGFEGAMGILYDTTFADVKPGPDWLHDIAMVDYDYLSQNGAGWFRDIDALTEAVKSEDRHKVLLALHGWYDYVGRYSYNFRTKALDREWVAFSNARSPAVQALARVDRVRPTNWPAASVKALQPVPMTLSGLHQRIRYAKDRGFRVGLYYADGVSACDAVPETYDPAKILRQGGWLGPDTKGNTYAQNPLHPEVRDFYLGYVHALLAEFGKEVDALIWDETFYVRPGDRGTKAFPGFADSAMLSLLKGVSAATAAYSPNVAFLASDCAGPYFRSCYAPVAHGTYQDSHCDPESWPYGLFPNYRNVLWSCNWNPVSNFRYTEYGVEQFDIPVAISNGACGDDTGFADLTPEMRRKILDLFSRRKTHRQQISWIEEEGGLLTYRGKPLKYRYSI